MIARGSRIKDALLAAIMGLAATVTRAGAEPPKCVIELFTSQGCAACPAADALLGRLSAGGSAITLSYPVDYWDYTGWKDTLALPVSSWRQKNYSAVRGDREIYTPQVVVDGITHAVGSDLDAIRRAIDDAHRHATPMSVPISVHRSGDRIRIEIGLGREAHAGSLWLLQIARSRTVTIRGGENAGRTVTYTNVVRGMTMIGHWMGAPTSFEALLEPTRSADGDGFVVLLQSGSSGRPGVILAAAAGDDLL